MIIVLFVAVLLFMQSRNKKDMVRGSFLAIILVVNMISFKFEERFIVSASVLNILLIGFVLYLYFGRGKVK